MSTNNKLSNDDTVATIKGSLEGLKVLDLTSNLAGLFAARLLADLGAEVVKIELENADATSRFGELSHISNHGVFCEKVNFRNDAGVYIIKERLKNVDVMLDNFIPGELVNMGLDAATLHTINPKLVMASITNFGISNALKVLARPWVEKAGYDINFMAMSGALAQLRTTSGEQAQPNMLFADLLGSSDIAFSILAAVFAARNTGKGRHISISMTHSLYNHMVMSKNSVKIIQDQDLMSQSCVLAELLPCYRIYRTQDDRYMAVGALELRFWKTLCETLSLVGYIEDHWQCGLMPNTLESMIAGQAMEKAFANQPMAYWQTLFEEVDACVTPVLSLTEAQKHPLFAHLNG